jgi:hypothetical protein
MKSWGQFLKCAATCCGIAILWTAVVPVAYSQTGSVGGVSVTVTDPAGAAVPDVTLQLKDLGTNILQKGATQASGTFTFPNVAFGGYQLTLSKTGFETQVFEDLQVQTGRTTDVKAVLKIGATQQTVTVQGESPLVEADSSVLSNTIDTKQVVNLPLQGRSTFALAFLVPGWASTSPGSTGGTWNNMPGGAIGGTEFDGTQAISNRFRSGGFTYGTSVVQPRIEDVAEMTVSTAQLDLSGNGVSSMKISLVTRRGSNAFHGRVSEDFQNTDLNANSWSNNARSLPRNVVKLNDFGGSVGGPILRNKLFFFGTYAQSIQPQSISASASVLSVGAQNGIFQYKASNGSIQSINVLQIGTGAGGPGSLNPGIASQLQQINGVLASGVLSPTSDPNISTSTGTVWGHNAAEAARHCESTGSGAVLYHRRARRRPFESAEQRQIFSGGSGAVVGRFGGCGGARAWDCRQPSSLQKSPGISPARRRRADSNRTRPILCGATAQRRPVRDLPANRRWDGAGAGNRLLSPCSERVGRHGGQGATCLPAGYHLRSNAGSERTRDRSFTCDR